MRGIRRIRGTRTDRRAPLGLLDLHLIARSLGDDLRGLRDRALITLGWAGAFRRSELTDLCVEDIEETDEGLRVLVRRSKTDQEGAGQVKAILRGKTDACPVRCLRAWLDAAGIKEGRVFRHLPKGCKVVGDSLTPNSVARIIKRAAERADIDPTRLAGHSLRSGFTTEAAARGRSVFRIMDVTFHRSVETVRGYVRHAQMFVDHPAEGML
jgi:integrase